MKFIDEAVIEVIAGNGGHGACHFHRSKTVTKGGPDGGDGGDGGDIILKSNNHLNTLYALHYKPKYKAQEGQSGSSNNKHGANGKPCIIEIPVGSLIKEKDTHHVLGELLSPQQLLVIAKGGRGGYGNTHYKSSTRQSPKYAQKGKMGEHKFIHIELKLLADVGFVGMPNAGKSSLLKAITASKPKIADYPFTTLVPNLGVVFLSNYHQYVVADIPGLLEDAHIGKGLGHRFLKHIEKTKLLAFIISVDSPIEDTFKILLHELKSHNPKLLDKKMCVVITKMDLWDNKVIDKQAYNLPVPSYKVSTFNHNGIMSLKGHFYNYLQ